MLKILKKINRLMDASQKRTMAGLIVMMVIAALLELVSVGIMIPVVQVILSPEEIAGNKWASFLYDLFGMTDSRSFAFLMLGLMMLAFVVKNVFLFIEQKALFHFAFTNQYRTSEKLMRSYIRRDYEFFLNAETGVLQRSITADVSNMYALILSVLQITTETITSVILVIYLFTQDAVMTGTVAVLLVLTLFVIKKIIKPIMNRTGRENQDYGASMFQKIAQAIGASRRSRSQAGRIIS